MDPKRTFYFQGFLFMLLAGFAASTTFLSGDVFQSYGSTGRNLLQIQTRCPISFEFSNYTIITSKCKGPQYPATLCCAAFKEFACPYADLIDDNTTDCATDMMTYINLKGGYPPGLFASECREGKEGLACPALPPGSKIADANTGHVNQSLFSLVTLVSGFVLGFVFSCS